jgi:hypothetical protein
MSPIDHFLREFQRTPVYIANARSVSPPDVFNPHECPLCHEETYALIRCEECKQQVCGGDNCVLIYEDIPTCKACAPKVAANDSRDITALHARRQAMLAFVESLKVAGGLTLIAFVCFIGAAL